VNQDLLFIEISKRSRRILLGRGLADPALSVDSYFSGRQYLHSLSL